MKNEALIGSIVLVLALGGIIWYGATRPAHPQTSPGTANASGIITEESQFYSIAAHTPTTTPLALSAGNEADAAAVSTIKQDVTAAIANFKSNTDPSKIPDNVKQQVGLGTSRKFTLALDYVATSSASTYSYIFVSYEDTLGAHPNSGYLTETFDAKTGAKLALKDLFATQTYLNTLSSITRPLLAQVLGKTADTNLIANGTAPIEANFQNFYLTPGNLVLVFPPYQVAPYAAGPQVITMPLAALKTVLKAQYQ